jgi:hypothetical protein
VIVGTLGVEVAVEDEVMVVDVGVVVLEVLVVT